MIIYRNHDKKIIRRLILEIGRHKYEQALENMHVKSRPIGMDGWYLESTADYLRLCYRYPSRYVLMLLDVSRFQNIPRQGCERIKADR